uniref:Uncharacterized protein n=1 Tax=Wuchereria bancrofti TaxID=6293 RepID=A0A1I8EA48_WUCBA
MITNRFGQLFDHYLSSCLAFPSIAHFLNPEGAVTYASQQNKLHDKKIVDKSAKVADKCKKTFKFKQICREKKFRKYKMDIKKLINHDATAGFNLDSIDRNVNKTKELLSYQIGNNESFMEMRSRTLQSTAEDSFGNNKLQLR